MISMARPRLRIWWRSIALKEDFDGMVGQTVWLATGFALSGTAALAQAGTSGYGSSVAPSVGSYVSPSVGSYVNNTPTWSKNFSVAVLSGNASETLLLPCVIQVDQH